MFDSDECSFLALVICSFSFALNSMLRFYSRVDSIFLYDALTTNILSRFLFQETGWSSDSGHGNAFLCILSLRNARGTCQAAAAAIVIFLGKQQQQQQRVFAATNNW